MQAHEIQISQFLAKTGTKFIIPVYQRNYDWKQKQCLQLLKDLESIKDLNTAYFIGSIVHQSTRNLTNKTELIIIDGQQRITTLTLLLYVLSVRFYEFGDEKKAEQIEKYYLFNEFDSNNNKLKLKPVNEDDEALQNLIQGNINQITIGHRIRENYEFFLEHIQNLEDANIYFDSFPKLTIVEISLDERDDPQKIFQSLNSTGLELSQADLIRNYILMNLRYEFQEKFYLKYWSIIEKNCRNQNNFESEISMFMRDYLTYKFNKIPSRSNVYEDFVEKNPDLNKDIAKLEEILIEVTKFSKYYSILINKSTYSDEIIQEIKNIRKLEVSVAYPFLLGVLNDFENEKVSEKELLNILQLVQTFVIRRFICDLPSNALQKIFMTLYSNSKKLFERNQKSGFDKAVSAVLLKLSSYQRFPIDDDIKLNLETKDIYRSQSKKRNYLLENLENKYHQFTEKRIDLENSENISIEHIFPQNPDKEYKELLGEQQYKEMQTLSNTIGNLTFVINNSSLGNKSFIEKRDLNKPESKGFKYSKFNLNESIQNLENWDLIELKKRTHLLTDNILSIWKFPEINLSDYMLEENEPISIESIEDPTNTQPKAIFINGSKKSITSNREMYINIIEFIYSKEPEVFFKPNIQKSLGISTDGDRYIKQSKIGNLYFYINLSTMGLYNNIKLLLNNVEEDYEILVQLKNIEIY